MPGRRTTSDVAVPKGRLTRSERILSAVRARLRQVFPKASDDELDSFTDRVMYYAREEHRKRDREVPIP
jgi:hypothetical protein